MASEADLNYVFQALAHETRRRIVRLLAEEGPMQFTELMERLGIEETGTFGFHVRRLRDLLERGEDGRYRLSELGRLAYRLIRAAEGGIAEIEALGAEPKVKVFNNISKLVVDREMLERHDKVAFNWIGTVIFTEDVDEELFKRKVLYFKGVGTIVVPKRLVRLAYGRLEEMCGNVVGYEGEVPRRWLEVEEERVEELENYSGTLILTRERLERAKEEGRKLRIENYAVLVVERGVTPELLDEVVLSIESYGPIYAPRELHRVIANKIEGAGGIEDIDCWRGASTT